MLNSAKHIAPREERRSLRGRGVAICALVVLQIISLACSELEKPKSEPYYSETTPPRKQEFRWSNGKAPKSIDPAFAAVPPETDLVRAVYEGLTELDPRTLEAVPAVAEKWTSSEDFRNWTFHIRADARWSNGKPVTAEDFVRSWKRVGELGDKSAHPDLLTNILGFPIKKRTVEESVNGILPTAGDKILPPVLPSPTVSPDASGDTATNSNSARRGPAPAELGVSAVDARTLSVVLVTSDRDFPKLVAHPLFLPVYGDGSDLQPGKIDPEVISNGAFRIVAANPAGIALERSESYWNRDSVVLERVRLVSAESAEKALAAYKAGELDAVTNVDFEPLALKLLAPFEDFRRRTHAAINFYEINHEKPPFDDRRVREALAIAIERDSLTEGEMEGQTQAALSFLPFKRDAGSVIAHDKDRARGLLEEAGFSSGTKFPVIKLVINRNDTQQRVARAVARMWKQTLNIDTEIVAKENPEVEAARLAGDFDLVRRNTVFPTADELMSILAILKPAKVRHDEIVATPPAAGVEADNAIPSANARKMVESPDVTMSEANAVYELWAIPLYFPTSYSLVKPYVIGFEMNSLDAPVLHQVSIDSDWQPK